MVTLPGHEGKCFLCGKVGHFAAECRSKSSDHASGGDEKALDETPIYKKKYQVGFYSLNCLFYSSI